MTPGAWSWSAEALVPVALGFGYLAVTGGSREMPRTAAFLGGCALLVTALVTPLDTLAREYLVWAHLVQNVVLAEWAPLLLVLGIPPQLAERVGITNQVAISPSMEHAEALGKMIRTLIRTLLQKELQS